MNVSGRVLKTERKAGDFTNSNGERVPYDFTTVRVLEDCDVIDVRIPGNRPDIDVPRIGDEVDYPVTARVAGRDVRITADGPSRVSLSV